MASNTRLTKSFFYVRLAFSIVCAGLCLLAIVFWVRSYFYADNAFVKLLPTEYVQVHAGLGRMCVWFEHKPLNRWFEWRARQLVASDYLGPDFEDRIPHFALNFWPTFARLYLAHWVLVVATALLAMAPWLPRNFTTRGLLTTIAVVAVVTGIITWVDRTF